MQACHTKNDSINVQITSFLDTEDIFLAFLRIILIKYQIFFTKLRNKRVIQIIIRSMFKKHLLYVQVDLISVIKDCFDKILNFFFTNLRYKRVTQKMIRSMFKTSFLRTVHIFLAFLRIVLINH